MSSFTMQNSVRMSSAPSVPLKRRKKVQSKIIVSESKLDTGNLELKVNMIYSDGFKCIREIRIEVSPNDPNYIFIKVTLQKISHILLADPHFKDISLEFDNRQVYLKMINGKVINITDHIDSSDLGIFIINQIMADSKMPLDEVCPILHENVKDLLDQGKQLVRIEGEPHIYHADSLEEAISYSGQNISPMTRQPIKKLIPVVKADSFSLPLKAVNPPELTKVESRTLDVIPEAMPMDVTMVVDASYSMGQGYMGSNMAYDPLKKYIQSLANGSFIKIITFSNDYKVSFDLADKNTLDLDNQLKDMLRPRGGTAFRDAMIQTINEFKNNEDERKHLLFVITDGLDYDSSYSIDDLNAVTNDAWTDNGKNIDCLFMHPPQLNGPDALQLSADNCLTFLPDPEYTEAAIASLKEVSKQYSCGQAPVITKLMRQSSCPARYAPSDNN